MMSQRNGKRHQKEDNEFVEWSIAKFAVTSIIQFCLRRTLGTTQRKTLFNFYAVMSELYAETHCKGELPGLINRVNKALPLLERDFPSHLQNDNFSKCDKCALFERALRRSHNVTKRRIIQKKREYHLRQQKDRALGLLQKKDASKNISRQIAQLIIDGMDQSKMYIPHFIGRKAKLIKTSDLIKTHITAVISHGHQQRYMFLDKGEYPHDSNLTTTILMDVLWKISEKGKPLPPTMFLQADNCWRENRNKYVMVALCAIT